MTFIEIPKLRCFGIYCYLWYMDILSQYTLYGTLTKFTKKGSLYFMFPITSEECALLHEAFKKSDDNCVIICSKRKRSGGKTYLCFENSEYHKFIDDLREKTKSQN